MSFTSIGRTPQSLRDLHSSERNARRQSYLARGRTIPLSQAIEPFNVASYATNSVAPTVNNAALNLPVPKKKKKTVRVTRRTLLRDVQSIKNKLNKRELKAMGISYGDQAIYTYAGTIPTLTNVNQGSFFISQPCQQASSSPLLVQGSGNGERIGDKVYYVTARYRLCFRLDLSAFLSVFKTKPVTITGLTITGSPTTSPWTGTQQSAVMTSSPLAGAGIILPLRVVSLAIREDYMNSVVGTNNRSKLRLVDIFTNMNDWDGNGGTESADDKVWLYSRKVKNEAAGKVRIKSDNIYYLSSTSTPSEIVVFDKNVPIRQQYSFEKGKTDGWVHGVLFHVPGMLELKKFMHGSSSIDWDNFPVSVPVVKMQGGACFYYYDD